MQQRKTDFLEWRLRETGGGVQCLKGSQFFHLKEGRVGIMAIDNGIWGEVMMGAVETSRVIYFLTNIGSIAIRCK